MQLVGTCWNLLAHSTVQWESRGITESRGMRRADFTQDSYILKSAALHQLERLKRDAWTNGASAS